MANSWITYVSEFRKKHPELSYKQCLRHASASYKQSEGGMVGMKPPDMNEYQRRRANGELKYRELK